MQTKAKKKLIISLSILVLLIMVAGTILLGVTYNKDTSKIARIKEDEKEAYTEIYGDFGWNYTDDGEAIISYYGGTGGNVSIPSTVTHESGITYTVTEIDYQAFSSKPITSVTIPSTVRKIGMRAFAYCRSLKSVSIPRSVRSIGDYAFAGCQELTSISIPDTVTEFGIGVFSQCVSLRSASTGNSVTELNGTFNGCKKLTDVTIGSSVETIGDNAFLGCERITNVKIPNSVKYIKRQAFANCSKLKSIVIPNSVEDIEVSAFSGCTSLTSILIPKSVTYIGEDAFSGCDNIVISCYRDSEAHMYAMDNGHEYRLLDELDSIEVYQMPTKTTYYVGDRLNTTGLVIKGINADLTTAGTITEYTCTPTELNTVGTQMITVKYQESGREFTTTFNVNVQEVSLQNISVTARPTKTTYFEGDTLDISGLVIEGTYSNGKSAGTITGYEYSPTVLDTVGNQVITVTYAANGTNYTTTFDVNVQALTIQRISIKEIPNTIYFQGETLDTTGLVVEGTYSNGTTVTLTGYTCTPTELNTVGTQNITVTYTEGGITKTDTFNVTVNRLWDYVVNPDGNTATITKCYGTHPDVVIPNKVDRYTVTAIGSYAFSNCTEFKSITIPNTVTTIKEGAFDRCTSLTNIMIPNSVTKIEDVVFNRCTSLVSIEVGSNNSNYSSQNGILFNKDKTKLLQYPIAKVGTTYAIPNTVTEIGTAAFIDCTLLENIVLLDSVVTIKEDAFTGCTSLRNITIPASVTTIEDNILDECDNVVISCYKNSKAHIYAENNSIEYILLDRLVSIEVDTLPSKVNYYEGDTLDTTGLVIKGLKVDNTTSIITGYTCTPTELNTVRTETITVKYTEDGEEFETSFNVSVLSAFKEIIVKEMPSKVNYFVGDTLDTTGLVLEGKKEDGTTAGTITAGYTCTPTLLDTVGTKTISVTYTKDGENFTTTFDVNVQKVELANIEIKKNPNKTKYIHKSDEEIDLTGGKIEVTYNNGSKNELDMVTNGVVLSGLNVSEYDNTRVGTQDIRITYTEDGVSKSATFNVTIDAVLDSIQVTTPPEKVEYFKGETLNTYKLEVVGINSDGTQAGVITGYECSPTELNTVQTQPITVTYTENSKEFETSFDVNVQKVEIQSISVIKNPNKTTYTKGLDELNLTGGKIEVTYNNGSKKQLDMVTNGTELSGLTQSGYDISTEGKQTITVTYTEDEVSKSATFDIEVVGIIIEYEENEDGSVSIKHVELVEEGNYIKIPDTIDGKPVTRIEAKSIPGKIGSTTIRIDIPSTLEYIDPKFRYTKKNTASLDVTPLRKVASISNAEYSLKVADEDYDDDDYFDEDDYIFEVDSTNTAIIEQLKEYGWHYILKDKQISGISVDIEPSKTEYLLNEDLNVNGGILLVKYADTNCEPSTIPMKAEDITFEGFSSSSEGNKTITVTYTRDGNSFTTTFNVVVKDYVTEITLNKSSINILYGTSLENMIRDNNIKYVVKYEGKGEQSEVSLTSDMMSDYDSTNEGTQYVIITYKDNDANSGTYGGDFRAILTINVTNGLTRIDMTAPTRTEYNHGESLDLSTMQIRYTYADGREIEGSIADVIATEIDGTRLNMSPTSYNSSNRLTKTIKLTIIKGDVVKAVNYTITILNNIKEIRMKPGTYKTEYKPNEELDLSGVKITAIRAVGQEDVQVTREMVSGFDTTTVGSKVVTISYGGEETTFTITVAKNKIKSESTSDGAGSKITEIEPNDDEDEIEIPKITDGKNVKEIGDYVIKPPKAGLTVIIPSTVEEIGEHAFDGCDEITIECETGSAAHQYAIEHGMNYELIDKVIASISMYVLPDKTVYEKNENLDLTGGRLLLTYTDGYTSPISIKKSGVVVSGYNKGAEGTQELIVTYKGHETSFDVNVLGDYIKGIDEGTTLQELKEKIGSDTDVKVYDTEGNEVTGGRNIGTGMIIEITQGGKTTQVVAVVKGDLDGDGRVTIVDVSRLQMHYIGIQLLSQIETNPDRLRAFEMAADTNEDGSIGIVDVSQIKMHYLGIQLFN